MENNVMNLEMKDVLASQLRQYLRTAQDHANQAKEFVTKAEDWSRNSTRLDPDSAAAMTSIQQCVSECGRLNEELDRSRTRILGMIEFADINFRRDMDGKMTIMEILMNSFEEIARLSCAVNQHSMIITRIYKDGIRRIRAN